MKKLIYLFVAGTMFAFTACGGGCATDCAKECCATEEVASDPADVIAAEEQAASDTEQAASDTVAAEEATEETAE